MIITIRVFCEINRRTRFDSGMSEKRTNEARKNEA